ncbi:MAG: zinc ribbon domain-containing protein [Lachnospiraceae bacterium]|nr:zinc ribbon domain-containing protein [Lachnospiraceae bacterium]
MERFCTNCGNKLPDGALFCTECGTRVTAAAAAAAVGNAVAEEAAKKEALEEQAAQQLSELENKYSAAVEEIDHSALKAAEEELAEKERLAEEARAAEEARLAEEARKAQEAAAEEARRAEEEAARRMQEEAKKAEEARLAEEQKRLEEEQKRLAEEQKKAEEEQKAAEKKAAEEEKKAEKQRKKEEKAQKKAEKEEKRKAALASDPNFYYSAETDTLMEKPVKTARFFWMGLLFAIPVIGLIAVIITSVAAKRESLRNFARANLIWIIVGLILLLLAALGGFIYLNSIGVSIADILNATPEQISNIITGIITGK